MLRAIIFPVYGFGSQAADRRGERFADKVAACSALRRGAFVE